MAAAPTWALTLPPSRRMIEQDRPAWHRSLFAPSVGERPDIAGGEGPGLLPILGIGRPQVPVQLCVVGLRMMLSGPGEAETGPNPQLLRAALYLTSLQEHCRRLGLGCKAVFSSTFTLELASVVPIEATVVL